MHVALLCSGWENIGVEYLSAALRAEGHEVSLLYDPAVFSGRYHFSCRSLDRLLAGEQRLLQRAQMLAPDLLGVSAYSCDFRWGVQMAARIKQALAIPVVFGGAHVTAVPERVIREPEIDMICIGEGEEALPAIAGRLAAGQDLAGVPSIWYKRDGNVFRNPPRPFVRNLDRLPFPDKNLFYECNPACADEYLIIAARGCVHRCTYCAPSQFAGLPGDGTPYYRVRSVENIVAELVAQGGKAQSIAFEDSLFCLASGWLEEFSREYRQQVGKPFSCNVRPAGLTAEKADLLRAAGCRLAYVGIQTASERIRKDILDRTETNDELRRAVLLLKDAGIDVIVDHMFGLPGETEENLVESLRFYAELRPRRVIAHWLTMFPGTAIIGHARNAGIIHEEYVGRIDSGDAGYLPESFGGGEDDRGKRACNLLLHLLPLLPDAVFRWLLEREKYRSLPAPAAALHGAMLVAAVARADSKAWHFLKIVIGNICFSVRQYARKQYHAP